LILLAFLTLLMSGSGLNPYAVLFLTLAALGLVGGFAIWVVETKGDYLRRKWNEAKEKVERAEARKK